MDEIKGKEKIVIKASREGLVEENLATGEEKNISGKKTQYLGEKREESHLDNKEDVVINDKKDTAKRRRKLRYERMTEAKDDIVSEQKENIAISKSKVKKSGNMKPSEIKKKSSRKNTYQRFKSSEAKEAAKNSAFRIVNNASIVADEVITRTNTYDEDGEDDVPTEMAEDGSLSSKYVFSNHKIKSMRKDKENPSIKQESNYERFMFRDSKENNLSVKIENDGNTSSTGKRVNKNKQVQKKKYKRKYASAKHSGAAIEGSATRSTSEKVREEGSRVGRAIVNFVKNNKVLFLILAVMGIFAMYFAFTFSGFSLFGTGVTQTVSSTTYPSADSTIYAAENEYAGLEASLNTQINNIETEHPGYDEYNYSIDEIGHNPYHLTSYLTVKYGNYDGVDVSTELSAIFSDQYTLTLTESTETREREKIDPDTGEVETDDDGNPVMEEYEAKILNVSLRNMGFDYAVSNRMNSDEQQYYSTLNATYGCRDYLWDTNTTYYAGTSGSDYEIPPDALSDERFKNMITEAEKYLGYPYVWGGASPETSFDCSGFVSWVINNCGNGWSYGRLDTDGLRSITAYVSAEDAKPGDLIFFQGTYNTSGTSHVGIYVGDGMMIHCGDPIKYSSVNTDYWQQHFHSYGRLP